MRTDENDSQGDISGLLPSFGKILESNRTRAGITQEKLAEMCLVTVRQVQRWEKLNNAPKRVWSKKRLNLVTKHPELDSVLPCGTSRAASEFEALMGAFTKSSESDRLTVALKGCWRIFNEARRSPADYGVYSIDDLKQIAPVFQDLHSRFEPVSPIPHDVAEGRLRIAHRAAEDEWRLLWEVASERRLIGKGVRYNFDTDRAGYWD